jgi:Divergent InlB B-repeat domain
VNGQGAVRSEPQGIRCRRACTRDYDAGTLVTLVASADEGRWFVTWSGACSGRRATCTVTMSQARFVHARFALELALRLQLPNRLVYHQPHEWATIRALATWRGKRLAGARVKIVVTCPGRRSIAAVLRTGSRGRIALRFGATMPESLRIYTCKVRGRVTANRRTARAEKPGTVRFIHPLWLKTRVTNGKIVVRIWGRAREPLRLFADGKQVSRSRIGRKGWVDIVSAKIQHGDMLRVTGLNGHAYHRIA